MTELEAIHSALKENMTVFDYSLVNDNASELFQELVGKKGQVISVAPTLKTISLDNILGTIHVDIVYLNVRGKTLPFLGGAEDILKRDRPIVFVTIDKYIIQQKHGYGIKDIRDFMLSVGYMNMKLAQDHYVFTFEYHPSRVLL